MFEEEEELSDTSELGLLEEESELGFEEEESPETSEDEPELGLEEELSFLSDEVDDALPVLTLTGSSSSSTSFASTTSTPCVKLELEFNALVSELVDVAWEFVASELVLSLFLPQPQNKMQIRQRTATKEIIFFIRFLR